MTDKTATLAVGGADHALPVLDGSVGPQVVDIRKFYGDTGMFTYDPGFTSTASAQSAITYIDGDILIAWDNGAFKERQRIADHLDDSMLGDYSALREQVRSGVLWP